MSKSNVRVALSVLISLVVILAVYTTVQGASLNATTSRVGSHQVGGLMTNFNHGRLTVAEQNAYQLQLESYNRYSTGSGHDCGSQSYSNPDD